LSKKVDFGGQKVNLVAKFYGAYFPALLGSNFAAYFTGCQIFGPEKLVKVDFGGRKFNKKAVFGPIVDFKWVKVDFKHRIIDLI